MSCLTPPQPLPPLLAASPFPVMDLVTCRGEPRFLASFIQCWTQPPAQPPHCHHGTWPPPWLKFCPPGKPVMVVILHHLCSRLGLTCQTFSRHYRLLAMPLLPKASCHWSSALLRKVLSSCRHRVVPACLPKNRYLVGLCPHCQWLMGSHLEVGWAPVKAAGSRSGPCHRPLSQPSPCFLLHPPWPSRLAPAMEKKTPATNMQGSAWLPPQPQYLQETVLDTSSYRSVFYLWCHKWYRPKYVPGFFDMEAIFCCLCLCGRTHAFMPLTDLSLHYPHMMSAKEVFSSHWQCILTVSSCL